MNRLLAAAWTAAALAGAALSGCTPELPAPDLMSTSPDWAYNGESTEVVLAGERFYPVLSVDLVRGDTNPDASFRVELQGETDTVVLEGVELHSPEELSGFVPEGYAPGLYDVVVTGPGGQQSELSQAFSITDTRADHLALDWDIGPYTVDEIAVVDIQLEDPTDNPVGAAMEVEVVFEGNSSGPIFVDSNLQDFVELSDSIRGRLDPAGSAYVAVTSGTADLFEVVARPVDPTSPVDESDIGLLSFEAGEVAAIEVDLPEGFFSVVAGASFPVSLTPVDDKGNPIHGERVVLDLGDTSCFGQVEPPQVELTGPLSIQVQFFRACSSTQLGVSGEAEGQSVPFRVEAGPVDYLRVQMNPSSPQTTVEAGVRELAVVVEALDAYENRLPTYNEDLVFSDDAGGLNTDLGIGETDCSDWALGARSCTLALEKAGSNILISATDQRGNAGQLDEGVTVLAADPAVLTVDTVEAQHTAGAAFQLLVAVEDAFGNAADIDPTGGDAFSVDDGFGVLACSVVGLETDGRHRIECIGTTADQGVVYTVDLPSWSLQGSSSPLDVVNGDLALIDVNAPSSVTAGESFSVGLSTFDAWGNPCTFGVSSVQLEDDSGAIAQIVTLGANGEATLSNLQITAAGARLLTASLNNQSYGGATVQVGAATLTALTVAPEKTWVWVGEDREISVTGIDNFGNTVTSYVGPVTVSSDSGLFVSRSVSGFTDGVSVFTVSWDDSGLGDRLRAEGPDGETGVSALLDAVETCSNGPTADLALTDDGVTCLVSGTGSVSADFSGSTAGDESLSIYHLSDGQGGSLRGTTSSGTVSSDERGGFEIELVVVDAVACADSATGAFWVSDPGEPAGEISVSLGHSSRDAGQGAADSDTTVTLSAMDCAGDVPTATSIYTRTDLGELTGVTPNSDGLVAPLSGGAASYTWSGQNLEHDGTAVVYVGTLDGSAFGSASLEVSGDATRPEVAWVDPSGTTDELFDRVTIAFTDDLLSTISSGDFDLTGPSGSVDFSLSVDGDEVTLDLDNDQDASDGTFTVTVTDDVRDEDGNRLDGDHDGNAGDYQSVFGAVQDDAITLDSCSADSQVLTPDGVDGASDETDEMDIDASASATPAWWRLTVRSTEGDRVRTTWTAGTSDNETLTWDARADGGSVVPAGEYTVLVEAVDEQDNVSDGCAIDVDVVEHYRSIP